MSLAHLVVLNCILVVPFLAYGTVRIAARLARFVLRHFIWGKVF